MQTANPRKIFSLVIPALSSLCLGIGFLPVGAGAAVVGLLAFGTWMAARRRKTLWMANLGLAVATSAAAYGLINGAALLWMLPATALALASWDLTLFDARLASNQPGAENGPLERAHDASLTLALAFGLLGVVMGQMVRFQIPFVVMLALVALAYVSLERMIRALKD